MGAEGKRIAVGSDHAGVDLKAALVETLSREGWTMMDLGPDGSESVDYPDFARAVCSSLSRGEADWGLLICGSGVGMAITANKFPKIRASMAQSEEIARLSRQHNNCNVLTLGARFTPPEEALEIARVFFTTPFEGGRHARRVAKIRSDCAYPAGEGVTVLEHPLIQHKLTLLRDNATLPKVFRETVEEVASLMAYDITRDLAVETKDVTTTLGTTARGTLIRGDQLVVVGMLRSGLGMVSGIGRAMPMAPLGHLGLRKQGQEWVSYLCKLPMGLAERTVILVKPLLGNGDEVVRAVDILKERGARRIKVQCILVAPEGIGNLHAMHPDVEVFTAAIDEGVDEAGHTLPGMGDVGDRIFGT